MNWLEQCTKLAKNTNISDRQKAIEIFATNSKLQDIKGSCDECKFVSHDKRSCINVNYKDCNIFTNSLFEPEFNYKKD